MAGDVQILAERPPTRLIANVRTPDGHSARWAEDGQTSDVPYGLAFSTTMPGGFEQCSLALNRDPRRKYPDLERLAHITVRSPGGKVAWEGRMDTIPDTGGTNQEKISPTFVGYQAHLQDDNSARMIFLDCDQSAWQGASIQRQLDLQGVSRDIEAGSTDVDPSNSLPAMTLSLTGAWSRQHGSEAWYDAQGINLSTLYYSFKAGSQINLSDTFPTGNWHWEAYLSSDDRVTVATTTHSAELAGNANGAGSTPKLAGASRKWALIELDYMASTAAGAEGINYQVFWPFLGVVGDHQVPIQGSVSAGAGGGIGVLASDMAAYIVGTWAPELRFTAGVQGSIRPSMFIIPQAVFKDPTTASDMLTQINAYEFYDWAVWDNKIFYFAPRDTFSKKWRVRIEDADLQETGPQTSRLFNGVVVSYSDVTGITRTVGPPGAGTNKEDPALLDSDPMNPVNEELSTTGVPLRKWGVLQMGTTSTDVGAIQVGRRWLQEQRLIDRSGQATLQGWVQNSTTGMWHPAWQVRAGDLLSIYNASDPRYRRIVRTDYSHDTRTTSVQLDAPPDGIAALLARMSVVLSTIPGLTG